MCAVSDLPLGGDLGGGRGGGGELSFAADAELLFCPNTRRKSNISRQRTLACMSIMLMSVITAICQGMDRWRRVKRLS